MTGDEIRARAERRVQELQAERERLVDALDHIERCCHGSRTSTRRIRFIALRARCAIDGRDDWRNADLPRVDPLVDKLRGIIKQIFPLVSRELASLIDSYTSPQVRDGATSFSQLLDDIDEKDVRDDCAAIRQFQNDARRNVPEINIEELRKGGDWIELT